MNNDFVDDRNSFYLKDYQEEIVDDLAPWKDMSLLHSIIYISVLFYSLSCWILKKIQPWPSFPT